jgi:hypothetical protein
VLWAIVGFCGPVLPTTRSTTQQHELAAEVTSMSRYSMPRVRDQRVLSLILS